MFQRNFKILLLSGFLLLTASCQRAVFDKETVAPASLRGVSALKMNFRFEADVPAPPETNSQNAAEEKNAAVQADFDQNRSQEALEKTLTSPNKQRILAIYRKLGDTSAEYRLDVYSPDGKLLRKITPNGMAVHFPDTIVWSPDGNNAAFVGMTRLNSGTTPPEGAPTPPSVETNTNVNTDAAANTDANANLDTNANTAPATTPTVADAPSNVLTLRTEQIYIANADGGDLKLLTQNEGLIYFYFIWSPDSSALVALAATWKEWQYGQYQSDLRGEVFAPSGRPRLIEKTGRMRLLDDNTTTVQPVWSPDSAKIALAYGLDVRIYDAIGDTPTQAAVPLRNPLLMSSKTFDDNLQKQEQETANANANANVNSNTNANSNANSNANAAPTPAAPQDVNTLPDENSLVSFNPIVQLEWTEDKMLYLQTGYIKDMKDAANSARSYLRWHRLLLSPQAVKVN